MSRVKKIAMENDFRLNDPYRLIIFDNIKTVYCQNRYYSRLGTQIDKAHVPMGDSRSIWLYDDSTQPWNSKTNMKLYESKIIPLQEKYADYEWI